MLRQDCARHPGHIQDGHLLRGSPGSGLGGRVPAAPGRPGLEHHASDFQELKTPFDASEADTAAVTEHTLSTVLQAKRLRQAGLGAQFEALSRDVETLRRFGDARAAVASLLIGSVQSGHVNRSQVTHDIVVATIGTANSYERFQ